MAREDLHFRLRIPEDLKKRIEAHAQINNRSMTAEIVSRLRESMDDDAGIRLAQAEVKELKLKLARQEGMTAAFQDGNRVYAHFLARAVKGETITLEEIEAALDDKPTANPDG